MDQVHLRLYIAGDTARSLHAVTNLREFCDTYLDDRYHLEIIDLLVAGNSSEAHPVYATPLLVRWHPPPPKHLLGDLSDPQRIIGEFELEHFSSDPKPRNPDHTLGE